MSNSVLYVENMEQRIIFLYEMMGQISDGKWENASPNNHWKFWGKIANNNNVKINPDEVGYVSDSGPVKDNYNFASPSLLNIVGERLLVKINLYHELGNKVLSAIDEIPDEIEAWENYERLADRGDKYYIEKFNKLKRAGINKEKYYKVHDMINKKQGYTMKDLKNDCRGLKEAFQTDLSRKSINASDMDSFL